MPGPTPSRTGMEQSARPRRLFAVVPLLLAVALLTATRSTTAEDWPHWRGASRNDVTAEPSGYANGEWQLRELWSARVGVGCSSPLLVAGRVYVTGWGDEQEHVTSLDAATGRELWTRSYAAPNYGRHSVGDKSVYAGPSATPEFDPERRALYTLGIDGDLTRWQADNGDVIWRINLYERYGVQQRPDVGGKRGGASRRDYGYTTSPLVHGETVIVEAGDVRTGTVKGLDHRTGAEVWSSECRDEAGHSGGPAPLVVDGIPCVAVLTMRRLVVVRLDPGHCGETLGQFDWTTDFANNIPTPTVAGDRILVTSAYNQSAMVCLQASRTGLRDVWKSGHPSGVCSPVVHEGRIYWGWRGIHCVDLATGKELWHGSNVGTTGSCLMTGDRRLITWADTGDLILCESEPAAGGAYRELARRARLFRTDVWPHVVLADGKLLVKDRDGNLKCYAVGR